MLYTSANLAAALAAGAQGVFNSVHFEPDGSTIATNGKCMVLVEPYHMAVDGTVPVFGKALPALPAGGINVPAATVKETKADLAAITKLDVQGGKVEFSALRKASGHHKKVVGNLNNAPYPQWRTPYRWANAAAARPSTVRFSVNRKQLRMLLAALDAAAPQNAEPLMFIEVPTRTEQPVMLRVYNTKTRQVVTGILSKVKVVAEWFKRSKWERKAGRRTAKRPKK